MQEDACRHHYIPPQLMRAAEWLRELIVDRTEASGYSMGHLGRLVYRRKKQATLVKETLTGVKRANLGAMIRYAEAVGLKVDVSVCISDASGKAVHFGVFPNDN